MVTWENQEDWQEDVSIRIIVVLLLTIVYFKSPFIEAGISPIWGLNRCPDSLAYTILLCLVPYIIYSTMFRIHSIISSFSLHGHQLSSTIQRDCPDHRRLVALGLQEPSELKEADALVALQTPLGSKALLDEWMTRWVGGSLIGLAGCLSKANPTSKNICTYIYIYIVYILTCSKKALKNSMNRFRNKKMISKCSFWFLEFLVAAN